MDNASNNDTFISALQRKINFSGSQYRIWYVKCFSYFTLTLVFYSCFPHIVNLACKAMLSSMSGLLPDEDLIVKLRTIIHYVSVLSNI
jgi:hypothetical protein